MITPEQLQKLSKHLLEIDPILDNFCKEYNFVQITVGLRRYPKRRIEYECEINLYFDIQMETDAQGHFFTKFFSDIPYSLTAGGWIDIDGFRYGKTDKSFKQVPFTLLKQNLRSYLQYEYNIISKWTVNTLKQEGKIGELNHGEKNHHIKIVDKNVITQHAELAKHLTQIDFVVDWFCKDFGFVPITPLTSEDHIKIVHHSQINLWLELKRDSEGERESFNEFLPDISYSLRGGAWINVGSHNYTKSIFLFQNWPLISVKQDFFFFLLQGYKYMSQWTVDFLRKE
jgi:hypothetical protein